MLLEVMIAFALISISVLPFLRYPSQQMTKEMELLFSMKLETIAMEELAKMRTEVLYSDFFKIDKIFDPKNADKSPIEVDKEFVVTLPGKFRRTYIKKNYLYWDSQKKDKDNTLSVCFVCETEFWDPKAPKKNKKPAVNASLLFVTSKKTFEDLKQDKKEKE